MKWIIAILVVCLVAFMVAGFIGLFNRAPAQHDVRLVGRWEGYWRGRPNPGPGSVFLLEDGEARVSGIDSIEWRTLDGVFYLKYKALNDTFQYDKSSYTISPDGHSVKFQGNSSALPTDMTRATTPAPNPAAE